MSVGADGGDYGAAYSALQSAISRIVANPRSFIAIKDSKLAKPPPGCSVWAYAAGSYALVLSNVTGSPLKKKSSSSGDCGAEFQCLCASCLSTFSGEVTSSTPGKHDLVVASAGLVCQKQKLKDLDCNQQAGYERAWDDSKGQYFCQLSLSRACEMVKVILGAEELQGSSSSPMVAKIGEHADLTVALPETKSSNLHHLNRVDFASVTVKLRPVQEAVAHASIDPDYDNELTLSLDTTGQLFLGLPAPLARSTFKTFPGLAGTFEIHLAGGNLTCKLPAQCFPLLPSLLVLLHQPRGIALLVLQAQCWLPEWI